MLRSTDTDSLDIFNILNNITVNYLVSKEYRKPSPKSVVGFPLVNDYNQIITADLPQLELNI